MRRLLAVMLGLLLAAAAVADGLRSVREHVEASMLVTGTIGITPQGTVLGYALDQPEKLPPLVAEVVGKTVPAWTFQPVLEHGQPVSAKARMSLRLVARPIGDGKFEVTIRSAYFGDPSDDVKAISTRQPRYPPEALQDRAGGTAYVVLRIDRAGHVADAFTEKVDMRLIAEDLELDRLRKALAEASVKALRHWTFTPAASTDHEPYREVRVPVSYDVFGLGYPPVREAYGQWQVYVPGPEQAAPWLGKSDVLAAGADALPGDGVYGKPSLSLLTPLDHG